MEQSIVKIQAQLMREYYKDFSKYAKGRLPEHKVAWVTAFTPVEILDALGDRLLLSGELCCSYCGKWKRAGTNAGEH